MKQITRKAISLLLSFAMLFGMVQGVTVPAFADETLAVSIGGVTVADSNWYAKTDASGTVTECKGTDDWNIHAVKDSGPPATATVTLKNATIENPSYDAPAIKASGYDLNIVLEGTANQIGIGAESSNGDAIYSSTANIVTITGEGDLTVKGNYGIHVNGSGDVAIDVSGSMSIESTWQMVSVSGNLTAKAKSISMDGYYIYCGNGGALLTAEDGDLTVRGNGDYGISATGNILLGAPKGAILVDGGHYSNFTSGEAQKVSVSAKNDITMTGTVHGTTVSVASETGDVAINGYYQAIDGAKTSVTVSASQGDVTLTSGHYSNVISGSGYTLAITAGGKLDVQSPVGITGYVIADIKAPSVKVALTGNGYAFSGGALTITNPTGGNCSAVSISGGGGGRDAVLASDVNIKANQVEIAAAADATNAINASGDVSIGDAGIIAGAVSIKGVNHISENIVQVGQSGGDASDGLDLKTTTPTQTTYYKAGDGYALFTPKNGETPAKLVLHNVTIHNTTEFNFGVFGSKYDGIALPAEPVTLQVEGTNKIISYDGNGISGDKDLTLSGDGTLTVEKTKCGININGSFTFADGAKVTLNSTVTAGDDSDITSTVYGKVAVESTNEFNTVSLMGAVTIAKGATLTVPVGQELRLDQGALIANNGIIVNNGTILLRDEYTAKQIQDLNLSGSILLYNSDNNQYRAYVNGNIYDYGDEINGDLDLTTPPLEATYYKAEDGYLVFTPAKDGTPASLTLHSVNLHNAIYLSKAPMTLYLEGTNHVVDMEASNALTISGSGSLSGFLQNSDAAAALAINSGATLNALYQTADSNGIITNTVYGSYTAALGEDSIGITSNRKFALAPGAVLTLAEDGHMTFSKDMPLSYLTIGAGASIVNNTYVTLPKGTTLNQIAQLPLSGTGVVKVATAYDGNGWPAAWDTYTNDGTVLKTISGGLDLTTGGDSDKTVKTDGYAWDGSTLTLGSVYIDGALTLPDNLHVVINTTANSVISGDINGAGSYHIDFTFTGTAPLTVNGDIRGFTNGDTITAQNGAQVTINGFIFIGDSGTEGTLNVTGSGTKLGIFSSSAYAVMCDTVNVQNGASLTVSSDSMGVEALTGGVNVTGGSMLTAGCEYGVYIIGGKLKVEEGSQLNTNSSVAPFCIVDTKGSETQSQVLALPGVPDGTQIASVQGTDSGYGYWSLVPTNGNLSVSDENSTPVTLTGAVAKSMSFVKPAATVSGVTVTPSTVSIQKGNSQTFSAAVAGAYEPSQTVTWSVEGKKSQSTAIDQSGKLTVATDETASTLTVKAVPIDDTTKYGTATVTVTGSGNPNNPTNPTDNSGKNSNSSSVSSLPCVLTDAATNVTVDLSGASFSSSVTSVTLSVTPVVRNSATDPQGAALYPASEADAKLNVIGTSIVYNIRLLDRSGNEISDFTGTVRVTMPLPTGLRGTPRVFRYEADGTFTDRNATLENGLLAFSTDHFSYYVIAGTGDSIILDTTSYQMPVNGSYQIGVKLTGSKAVSVKVYPDNSKTVTATKLANRNYKVTAKKPGTVYIMYDVYDNKNKLLTHASVRVDVKTGIRPRGDSTRQIGVF